MNPQRSEFAAQMNGLTFSYAGGQPMVFDCAIASGVTTAIMGPSGSGKSTMLSLLAGFEVPSSGKIWLNGVDATALPPAERPLSMVFQSNNLFAHLSLLQNVGLGLSPSLRLSPTDIEAVEAALQAVNLPGYARRMPSALSGGERQRVALARVLVQKRPILLLDEAFSSLGPGLREEMLDLVAALSKEHNLTTIMVTHAPSDAVRIAQNLIFIDKGTVVLSGSCKALLSGPKKHDIIVDYLGEDPTS